MLLVLLLVASASPALAGQFVMNVWKSMVTARMGKDAMHPVQGGKSVQLAEAVSLSLTDPIVS